MFKVINIIPQPALRPRVTSKGWAYNPKKYEEYKRALKLLLKLNHKTLIETPVKLYINFYMPIPKSWSNKKKLETVGQAHFKKPDLDNLIKAFKDSANGIIFKDDSVVSAIVSSKVYSNKPRIEYKVEKIDE